MKRTLQVFLCLCVCLPGSARAGQVFTEFLIPTASSNPLRITPGSDGNLWFTELLGNKIGRITPAGVITEFTIPSADSNPGGIEEGSDGNVWFTEELTNKIGRITPAGVITEFTIPTADSFPGVITPGPDGNIWFTEYDGNKIGRITTSGAITEFHVPTPGAGLTGIVSGPDGNLWFTERLTNKIGRITLSGTVTEYNIPTAASGPDIIRAALDENLWFTEFDGNKIGKITTAGVVTEFTVPTGGSNPAGIGSGPDGNVWFTEYARNKIGRITTAGVITEFPVPTAGSNPGRISAGPDGNLWFTEETSNKIGRLTTGAGCNIDSETLCLSSDRYKVQADWATSAGGSGQGQAIQLTADTGYFWFFSSSNVEMVVKVLNACGINQKFWVFGGGLTNVQVDLTVTDTLTGIVKHYHNPQSTAFLPIQDTGAFPTCNPVAVAPDADEESSPVAIPAQEETPAPGIIVGCVPTATSLCLEGRFRVQAQWTTSSGTGSGQAVPLTTDTGYFWFFSSTNVEMILKVLNGCGINSKYWVFAGGLTNVQVDMTVTDTQTGLFKMYHNLQNTAFLPIQDTGAFTTCSAGAQLP